MSIRVFLATFVEAWGYWRLEGYDGKPTSWRDAWGIAKAANTAGERIGREYDPGKPPWSWKR